MAEPQVARWGSTKTERRACWPGDELVDDPGLVWTNAVTIDRPASEVWPWIAQLGQGRGGLCSYDWLENLLGCDVHSARRVLPQFQKPLPVGADVVVEPAGAGSSRLIVRSRATSPMARPQGPAQFVMQRRSMLGIKERAEGTSAPWTVVVLEPLLWLLATAVFVAGATMASGGSDRSGHLESRSRRSAWSTRQRSAGRRFLRASRWSAHPCSPWS